MVVTDSIGSVVALMLGIDRTDWGSVGFILWVLSDCSLGTVLMVEVIRSALDKLSGISSAHPNITLAKRINVILMFLAIYILFYQHVGSLISIIRTGI